MKLLQIYITLTLVISVVLPIYSQLSIANQSSICLGSQFKIYRDFDRSIELDQILQSEGKLSFSQSEKEHFSEAFVDCRYWFVLDIWVDQPLEEEYILEIGNPNINHIQVSLVQNEKITYQSSITGDVHRFSSRPLNFKNFVYPLKIEPNKAYQMIIMADSEGESMVLPAVLWSKSSFERKAYLGAFGSGFYFSSIAICLVLIMLLFLYSKEKMYLFYFMFLVVLAEYMLDIQGLNNQYFWFDWPMMQNIEQAVLAPLLVGFFIQFTNSFLNIKSSSLGLYKLFKYSAIGLVILSFSTPIIYIIYSDASASIQFINSSLALVVMTVFLAFIALKILRFELVKHLVYMIAFGVQLLGFMVHSLTVQTCNISENYYSCNFLYVSSYLSVIIFTSYLIVRIRNIWRANETLQLQISMAKSNAFQKIVEGENKQRKKTSKILTNRIGSILNSIENNINRFNFFFFAPNDYKKLENIKNDLLYATENLNRISNNLDSKIIQEAGIINTLLNTFDRLRQSYPKMEFEFATDIPEPKFDQFEKTILLGAIEEILLNALKHSQAKKIEMQIHNTETELTISIIDNGVGFDPDRKDQWGIGLKNINSRLELLKADLLIESNDQVGSHIKISIPLNLTQEIESQKMERK